MLQDLLSLMMIRDGLVEGKTKIELDFLAAD
jgi:hypothetical protein